MTIGSGTGSAGVARIVTARLDEQLHLAARSLASDAGASPVLAAVLDEFQRKFDKTRARIDEGAGERGESREAVVELEQAADSAKWAATADLGASEQTRQAIVRAHDHLCIFKSTGRLVDGEAE